ncbi:MAG: sulfurtransferase [Alphaproteobacteria bacterium]|nr:sulfurtransferase [Alphaproteobacteria bacterium]MCB9928679.1 sulfurtransferase [Alphaproteobacteria bacterium]
MSETLNGFGPLVSTAWLADHLDHPGVRVLDCTVTLHPLPGGDMRAETGLAAFEDAHIPGAGFADLIRDLSDTGSPLRFTLPPAEAFAAALGRLGVGNGTHLVLYADVAHWATRLWWMLRHYGFDMAGVLDGGLHAWTAEGRPLERGAAQPVAAQSLTLGQTRGLFCDLAAIRDAIGAGDILTVNALTEEQHSGGGTHYGRPGRIPGSVCVAARSLTDPAAHHRFRPLEALRQDFAAVGALAKPQVITYCGGGIAATGDAFVLHLLGQDHVRVYDASLQEWAKSDQPMETG